MRNEKQMRISPDALIALVAVEAEGREQKRLSQLEQEESEFEPSPQFAKRMSSLLKKFYGKQRAAKVRKGIKAALIAATASLSLFSIALFPSAAVREAVKDTVIVWKKECASIVFANRNAFSIDMPVSIQVDYSLENFELDHLETFETEGRYVARYFGPSEEWYTIRADYIDNCVEITLDNEHSRYYSIEFKNHSALWVNMQDGTNVILWKEKNVSYMVYGSIELVDLLAVAESIITTH